MNVETKREEINDDECNNLPFDYISWKDYCTSKMVYRVNQM
jgi:hypothetical protein